MDPVPTAEEREDRWEGLPPRTIGRYTLYFEIGAGGMASVFLARESGPAGLARWVAIKRIHPHLGRETRFVEMFLDEARLAARISHPNVTQLYELGEAEGTWYMAMEYLHGETLSALARALWRSGEMIPWPICVRIAAQACEGLQHAHDLAGDSGEPLGLVHRDVSPQNLLVTYAGIVKVMDFGIAKAAGKISQTNTGALKGKVSYMSPEQVRGRPVDRRSDVFSLGVVLWELSTGRRLFKDESEFESMRRVTEAEVRPPTELGARIPQELEKVILRALSREPDDRFPTAAQMQRELELIIAKRGYVVGSSELSTLMRKTFADRIGLREALLRTPTVPPGAQSRSSTWTATIPRPRRTWPSTPPGWRTSASSRTTTTSWRSRTTRQASSPRRGRRAAGRAGAARSRSTPPERSTRHSGVVSACGGSRDEREPGTQTRQSP
jgi:serine/threonine-protein kinase